MELPFFRRGDLHDAIGYNNIYFCILISTNFYSGCDFTQSVLSKPTKNLNPWIRIFGMNGNLVILNNRIIFTVG
jgi:hypothetical protein